MAVKKLLILERGSMGFKEFVSPGVTVKCATAIGSDLQGCE